MTADNPVYRRRNRIAAAVRRALRALGRLLCGPEDTPVQHRPSEQEWR